MIYLEFIHKTLQRCFGMTWFSCKKTNGEKKQKKQKQNGQSQKQRRNVDEPIAIHTGDQSHLYRTGEWKWQLDLLTTKTT